jgi:excinuclease ABC subunit A
VYVLDEPTTGLHFEDIRKLLRVLESLVDKGNTVIVIEHNLDVIKTADWLIEMGPDGGHKGGTVVATGTPEEIAEVPESATGQFLRHVLKLDGEAAGAEAATSRAAKANGTARPASKRAPAAGASGKAAAPAGSAAPAKAAAQAKGGAAARTAKTAKAAEPAARGAKSAGAAKEPAKAAPAKAARRAPAKARG